MCLAFMFTIQKLRHYIQAHTVYVIPKANPIKYVLFRPVLHGLLTKWAVILEEYNHVHVSHKAIKRQIILIGS